MLVASFIHIIIMNLAMYLTPKFQEKSNGKKW